MNLKMRDGMKVKKLHGSEKDGMKVREIAWEKRLRAHKDKQGIRLRPQDKVRYPIVRKSSGNSQRKKVGLLRCSGYSTVFDALFLLVLISLAGVLLMPSMQAEKQYSAAGYVTSSEMDTYVLESLLSCKLEDFEYEISPLSALNISTPENSVVENPSHTLFAKEQKHRTFADLVAEYLALSPKYLYEFSASFFS